MRRYGGFAPNLFGAIGTVGFWSIVILLVIFIKWWYLILGGAALAVAVWLGYLALLDKISPLTPLKR